MPLYATYPNPAADELTIDGLNGSEAIKVLDIFGRTMIEGRNSDGKNKKTLNIRLLPNGAYLINVQMPDGFRLFHKVIKKNKQSPPNLPVTRSSGNANCR